MEIINGNNILNISNIAKNYLKWYNYIKWGGWEIEPVHKYKFRARCIKDKSVWKGFLSKYERGS